MKMEIPKGWRRLRVGETIKDGDRFWSHTRWDVTSDAGLKVGKFWLGETERQLYIRRK